jgi:hypothetical protein
MARLAVRSKLVRASRAHGRRTEARQRDAHVVLDVVGQHAQEHVRLHAHREPVIDGAHLQIDALQRSERALDEREAFVGRNSLLRAYFVRWQAGSHDVNAIEPRLGCDLILTPPKAKRPSAMSSAKRFFILCLSITAPTARPSRDYTERNIAAATSCRSPCSAARSSAIILCELPGDCSSDTLELTLS